MIKESRLRQNLNLICYGFLMSQGTKDEGALFVAIDMQNGGAELRINEKKPFGFPLDHIKVEELFKIITKSGPGFIETKVDVCNTHEYINLLNNSSAMRNLNDHILSINEDFKTSEFISNKIKELRDSKIYKIIT